MIHERHNIVNAIGRSDFEIIKNLICKCYEDSS